MAEVTRRGAVAASVAAGVALVAQQATAQPAQRKDGPIQGDSIRTDQDKLATRAPQKRWVCYVGFASVCDVATFLNRNPAQGAGEAIVVPVGNKFDVLAYL